MFSFCTGRRELCRQCWLWSILSPLVWSLGHLDPGGPFVPMETRNPGALLGPAWPSLRRAIQRGLSMELKVTFQTLTLTYYCGRLYLLSSCFLVEP